MRGLMAAFSLFSKIPMPHIHLDEKDMRLCLCFFPLVGVVLGVLEYAAAQLLLWAQVSSALTVCILCTLPVLFTGGIHLDGFIDTSDALCSYGSREKKLEILKDAHVGAFAVIRLVVWFLFYYGALFELVYGRYSVCGGIAAWCVSFPLVRSICILFIVYCNAAKENGMGSVEKKTASKAAVRIAGIFFGLLCIAVLCRISIVLCVVTVCVLLAVSLYYYHKVIRQFGGITGDLSGWFISVSELSVLLALVAGSILSNIL